MRHYEIIALIHPDQKSQIETIIDHYCELISKDNGIIHRREDWGCLQLAYPINKQSQANYVLMNVECDTETMAKLAENFKFSDAVLRTLVVKKSAPETGVSPILQKITDKEQRNAQQKSSSVSSSVAKNPSRGANHADEAQA